jgi:thioredoxin-like negative regulator of GroEL
MKINEVQFKEIEEKLHSDTYIILVYTHWSGSALILQSVLEKLKKKHEGKFQIYKMDIEKNTNFIKKYRINAIPCILIFNNSVLTKVLNGISSIDSIEEEINNSVNGIC